MWCLIITGFLAIDYAVAVPLTAGASGIVAGMIIAGGLATGMQCAIGSARLYAIYEGQEDYVAWIDSQSWYVATTTALDVISLAGAGAGLKSAIETYKVMKAPSSAKAIDWLKTLSRAERKKLQRKSSARKTPVFQMAVSGQP